MLDVKLDTLLAVAESGSFTKAAELLSLTQPAVSHHINQLEEELGAKLFIRGKSEIKTTPEGDVAIRYARRLKAMYERMLLKIANAERNLTSLRIGITHTAESNKIIEILAKYSKFHYNTSITIITDTIKNLYEMIDNYELDLAVVEGKIPISGLNFLMLDTDYLVCVVSNKNPLAKKSMLTVNDLKKENMILRLPTSATRMLFEATLMSINESIGNFNISIEVDNIATIKDLVRKGLGISILPKSACLDELRKGKLTAVPIENLSMLREVNIVYNKMFSHIDILQDIVKLYHDSEGNY